jgi:IS605 OrfB family transposase
MNSIWKRSTPRPVQPTAGARFISGKARKPRLAQRGLPLVGGEELPSFSDLRWASTAALRQKDISRNVVFPCILLSLFSKLETFRLPQRIIQQGATALKLIAQVKLQPTPEQVAALRQTLEAANAACNVLSEWVWQEQTFGQWALHKERYNTLRAEFNLPAQVAVRAISKVADAYKLDKRTQRQFRPHGSIAYDDRILTWRTEKQFVTIATLKGRLKIAYVCGERQKQLLVHQQGETDLVYRNGEFYLLAVCNVVEPEPQDIDDALGIDMGIVNIATDSDGNRYSGKVVNALRKRHRTLRAKLQARQTPSARRLLKRRRLKEQRFASDVNHQISKKIVSLAQRTNRAVTVEDLTGIRTRTRVKKPQRATHHSWAFFQLRSFVEYKAKCKGIPVFAVDPRYTSQRCSECGHTERANRPNQHTFCCQSCGFSAIADCNAAYNLRDMGRAELSTCRTQRAA